MGNPAEMPSLSLQAGPCHNNPWLLVYWCASRGGQGGMALYAASPLPLASRAGQNTHWVPVNYPSLKTKSVPWHVMDKFSKHWPVTSAMGSNLLGGVSAIWHDISICWWRPAAFLIFYWPLVSTFVLCIVEILEWYFQVPQFYCGETEVSPSNAGGKKSSALLTLLVLKLTVVSRGGWGGGRGEKQMFKWIVQGKLSGLVCLW